MDMQVVGSIFQIEDNILGWYVRHDATSKNKNRSGKGQWNRQAAPKSKVDPIQSGS